MLEQWNSWFPIPASSNLINVLLILYRYQNFFKKCAMACWFLMMTSWSLFFFTGNVFISRSLFMSCHGHVFCFAFFILPCLFYREYCRFERAFFVLKDSLACTFSPQFCYKLHLLRLPWQPAILFGKAARNS